jgi:hypothetical protein
LHIAFARLQLGLDLTAAVLDLETGGVDLGSRRTSGHDGPADPRNRLPAPQQAPDCKGRFNRATRRMEIDRAPRILHGAKETANAGGGPAIDLAFDRNPAIATRSARIGRAPGKTGDELRRESGFLRRRFCARFAMDQQQRCGEEETEYHEPAELGIGEEMSRRN